MKIILLIILVFSNHAKASIEQAPPNFKIEDKNLIWVDFQSADYKITYDTNINRASAISTISFIQKEDGYPLFDSVSTPKQILINGIKTKSIEVATPNEASKV